MRRLTIIALALSATGCSFVVGGTPPECMSNDQCAILNTVEGISADACELYQCSTMTRTCELSIRDQDGDGLVAPECAVAGLPVDCNDSFATTGEEVCNGADDDCDGVIDEGAPIEPPTTLVDLGSVTDLGPVGYGATTGALAVAHADGTATFGLVEDEAVTNTSLTTMRTADLSSLTSASIVEGCYRLTHDGMSSMVTPAACSHDDIDFGVTADNIITAFVSANGCADGTLRIGHVERTQVAGGELIERGPLRRSPIFTGVDAAPTVMDELACTGLSRASGRRGAARPSVAAMSGSRDQALVGWLADSVTRTECGGDAVDVEVLGAFVMEDTFAMSYRWVSASNEGQPQVVGSTTGGGRPGVAAWDGTGYLVAFGASGGVELSFVAMPAAPPAYSRMGDPTDRTGFETDALVISDVATLPAGAVDDVVLAFGSIRTGGIDVGVAWREGCGTGAESIHFRQLRLANDFTLDESNSHPAVELAATSAAGPPAIAYAYDGFLEHDTERADGRPTGSAENDGGWVVAFEDASDMDPGPVEDRRVLAQRISEADGAPLGEAIALHAPGDRRRTRPALYTGTDGRVRFAFVELGGDTDAFRGGALTCLPPG